MARKVSQNILDAIKKRSKVKQSDMSPKEESILKDIYRLSNKIAVDGKFGPAQFIEISESNHKTFSEEFKSKIEENFEVKFNEDLRNKIRIYRKVEEEDINIYVDALGYDKDYLIKNQEAIIGI